MSCCTHLQIICKVFLRHADKEINLYDKILGIDKNKIDEISRKIYKFIPNVSRFAISCISNHSGIWGVTRNQANEFSLL